MVATGGKGESVKLEPVMRKTGGAIDDRFHAADYARRAIKKAFPDQWSFFLGEVALYSFIILIITGIYLTLFFVPSLSDVVYHGSYAKLDGEHMSEAYESTLNITFDIRGGLLVRQIHHWAANIFVAAIAVHALRIFFTGAFRKPREVNWVIGTTMFALAAVEGFAGYSMPDDMLSGTGVRIAEGIMESIPIVGTYVVFFFFGGQYPGEQFDARLYIAHVLLLPGLILALVTAHLMVLWHQGHTQFPGKKEREHVEVGAQFFPTFIMKTTLLFFFVFFVLALLGAVAQINPIWLFGPYNPLNVSNGSQPDWYIGFMEGSLRLMPGVESNVGGHTFVWNVFLPAVLLPILFFILMYAYPFFERWVTGDNRPHNVLDRPRNAATRTALGVAVIVSGAVLQIAAGDDVISYHLGLADEDLVLGAARRLLRLPRDRLPGDATGLRSSATGGPPQAADRTPVRHHQPVRGRGQRGRRGRQRRRPGVRAGQPPGVRGRTRPAGRQPARRADPSHPASPGPAPDTAPGARAGPRPGQPVLPAVGAGGPVQGRRSA